MVASRTMPALSLRDRGLAPVAAATFVVAGALLVWALFFGGGDSPTRLAWIGGAAVLAASVLVAARLSPGSWCVRASGARRLRLHRVSRRARRVAGRCRSSGRCSRTARGTTSTAASRTSRSSCSACSSRRSCRARRARSPRGARRAARARARVRAAREGHPRRSIPTTGGSRACARRSASGTRSRCSATSRSCSGSGARARASLRRRAARLRRRADGAARVLARRDPDRRRRGRRVAGLDARRLESLAGARARRRRGARGARRRRSRCTASATTGSRTRRARTTAGSSCSPSSSRPSSSRSSRARRVPARAGRRRRVARRVALFASSASRASAGRRRRALHSERRDERERGGRALHAGREPASAAAAPTSGSTGGGRRGRSFERRAARRDGRGVVRARAPAAPRRVRAADDGAAQLRAAVARRDRHRRLRCSSRRPSSSRRSPCADGSRDAAARRARGLRCSRTSCTSSSTSATTSSPSARRVPRRSACCSPSPGRPVGAARADLGARRARARRDGRASRSPRRTSPSARWTRRSRARDPDARGAGALVESRSPSTRCSRRRRSRRLRGTPLKALRLYRQATDTQPENPEAWVELGLFELDARERPVRRVPLAQPRRTRSTATTRAVALDGGPLDVARARAKRRGCA